jgi:hypothetical protein
MYQPTRKDIVLACGESRLASAICGLPQIAIKTYINPASLKAGFIKLLIWLGS